MTVAELRDEIAQLEDYLYNKLRWQGPFPPLDLWARVKRSLDKCRAELEEALK